MKIVDFILAVIEKCLPYAILLFQHSDERRRAHRGLEPGQNVGTTFCWSMSYYFTVQQCKTFTPSKQNTPVHLLVMMKKKKNLNLSFTLYCAHVYILLHVYLYIIQDLYFCISSTTI